MNDPILYAKTKHIKFHHHYIREKVKKNAIEVVYIPTQEQDVDNFHKTTRKDQVSDLEK